MKYFQIHILKYEDFRTKASYNLPMLQGVPYYWARFVFVIFSGSRAHTEELFIAIG